METLLSKNLRYGELQDRLLPLMKLEEILDSEHLIFRYSSSRIPYSKIRADYIINGKLDDTEAFVFLVTNLENCSCCSIFCKNEVDYTKQQLKFSILLKRKIRQSDGKVLYEYIRTGYQV